MKIRTLTLVTLAATLVACGSVPERNSALDQARGRYNAAQRDAQVTTLAPDELKQAGDSLALADRAWNDSKPVATVDHLAYMAVQRVVIARDVASSRASQAITAGAAAERDKVRLAMRTSEVDAAQQKLAIAQQDNAIKTAELSAAEAAARAQAQRNRAQIASDNARINSLELQLKDLNAQQTERGYVVTLGDVFFQTGAATIVPTGNGYMEKLADAFKRSPTLTASIEGHADSVGDAGANYALSQRRADAVMSALAARGVSPSQLSTQAFGEERPTANNDTSAGRQMNRRVEIVFAK